MGLVNTWDKHEGVDWTQFAYMQYVTVPDYLCNSLMILEALHRSGSKADRIMMYPQEWYDREGNNTEVATTDRLLTQARDLYGTTLLPVKVQTIEKGDATWKDSFTKLLAFNQTQYKRLISLDSDATLKQVRFCF
jgi:alpha-N-acetylglucosamine transferase